MKLYQSHKAGKKQNRRGVHPVLRLCLIAGILIGGLALYMYYQYSKQNLRLDNAYQVSFSNHHHALPGLGQQVALLPDQDIPPTKTEVSGARSFLQVNLTTKEAVASKEAAVKLDADGLHKLMTLLIALEQAYDRLDETVTLTASDVTVAADQPSCGFHEGDELTLRNLLFAMMVYDGDDAAKAVARFVAGDEGTFVELMNAKAKHIGATQTHFINPQGGGKNGEQYTTAYDLYLIYEACLKQGDCSEFMRLESVSIPFTRGGQANGITYYNRILYLQGVKPLPAQTKLLAAKSGATVDHGQSMLLHWINGDQEEQFAVFIQSNDRERLYQQMDALLK